MDKNQRKHGGNQNKNKQDRSKQEPLAHSENQPAHGMDDFARNVSSPNLDSERDLGDASSEFSDTTVFSTELRAIENELAELNWQPAVSDVFESYEEGREFPKFGKYTVHRVLGRRGQAAVFVGYDEQLQRHVVIKIYHSRLATSDKEFLLREGRALSRLDSPHVVRCLAVEEFRDHPYLVLEYVRGETLEQLYRMGEIDREQLIDILDDLSEGLACVHAAGMIHGDLKPSNVVIDKNGAAKLIDFGLATRTGSSDQSVIAGTPGFMPPERLGENHLEIDVRSDLFGLGAIAYYLMTGQPPFQGENREQIIEQIKQTAIDFPDSMQKSFGIELVDFCRKCLQPLPFNRYASTDQARQTILSLRQKPEKSPRRFRQMIAPLVGVAALLMISLSTYPYWRAFLSKQPTGKPDVRPMSFNESPNGFKMEIWIDGLPVHDKKDDEPIVVYEGVPATQFEFSPELNSNIAVFNVAVNEKTGHFKLDILYPLEGDVDQGRVAAGNRIQFEAESSKLDCVEHLLFVAISRPWNIDEFVDRCNQTKSESDAFSIFESNWRDFTRDSNQVKIFRKTIPYRVEKRVASSIIPECQIE